MADSTDACMQRYRNFNRHHYQYVVTLRWRSIAMPTSRSAPDPGDDAGQGVTGSLRESVRAAASDQQGPDRLGLRQPERPVRPSRIIGLGGMPMQWYKVAANCAV